MKIQHLAVIFIIIVLPISLVLSVYTGNMVKVSNKQASYDALLLDSTYDAIRAYQMNTLNNHYSSESNSKIRDINASINSFFNSLATGLSGSGYTKTDLNTYVPSLLYTLYDGYYVYGCYKNVASISDNKPQYSSDSNVSSDTEYGLKSYVYYTCEYKDANKYDIIINYTLDNYISIYGTYSDDAGNEKYIAASGYYINTNGIQKINDKKYTVETNGKTTTIEPEVLGEYISTTDNYYDIKPVTNSEGGSSYSRVYGVKKNDTKYYNYIEYNNVKYYFDDDNVTSANSAGNQETAKIYSSSSNYYANKNDGNKYKKANYTDTQTINLSFNNSYDGIPIFRLDNNLRVYINKSELDTISANLGYSSKDVLKDKNNCFKDMSACYYYENATDFSNTVYPILKRIDVSKAVTTDTYNLKYISQIDGNNITHAKTDYDTPYIFDFSKNGNNPELETSSFYAHRVDVIVSSIESSLVTSIKNFNDYTGSTFQYSMPVLSEEDWYKIANNMTVVSFLQGLIVGNYKYYSNYSVVSNTKSVDYVSKDSIYVQDNYQINNSSTWNTTNSNSLYKNNQYTDDNNTVTAEYHDPRCLKYNSENGNNSVIGYRNTEYDRNTFNYTEQEYYTSGGKTVYNYDGAEHDESNQASSENYYLQAGSSGYECIVSQNDIDYSTDDIISGKTGVNDNVRNAYIIALARERGAIYKFTSDLNGNVRIINRVT